MKRRNRRAALLLAVCLLLTLTGCARANPFARERRAIPELQTASEETEAAQPLCAGGYFGEPARGSVPYAQMQPETPQEADFAALCDTVLAAAEARSPARVHAALEQLHTALLALHTAYTLADLRHMADAGSEDAAAAADDAYARYSAALDRYYDAMHTLCRDGAYGALLEKEFDEGMLAAFAAYDPASSDASLALLTREQALVTEYEIEMAKYSPDPDTIGEIFVSLIAVRSEMAAAAGYDSYADYAYAADYARDYTPAEARALWTLAKEQYAPLLREYADDVDEAARRLTDEALLDLSEDGILTALQRGAAMLSPELAASCAYLIDNGLYDIAANDRKADIGFTTWLASYEAPFLFNAPYGDYYDLTSAIHEFGHYNAYYYNGSDVLFGVCDYDLSELQSQGMEVMFLPLYDALFGEEAAALLRAQTVYNLMTGVVQGAMYDEFQQTVYRLDEPTPARVNEAFLGIYESYGYEPYDGAEYEWMSVIHNFEQPMYYISYAVSALPALELYAMQQKSPADALDTYLRAAAMADEWYYLSDALEYTGLHDQLRQPLPSLPGEICAGGVFDLPA